ncbi:hypothetical protein DVS28_a3131 [Euzebya pacifica]|uniref:Uncharacterized protein n=1 Tax=Euzebya pacifica TaxID=1608957 RepID=A0A346Y010_9ACTN|nr:hypothetical protein DVS28_a3131 [Euzebya pacifica]
MGVLHAWHIAGGVFRASPAPCVPHVSQPSRTTEAYPWRGDSLATGVTRRRNTSVTTRQQGAIRMRMSARAGRRSASAHIEEVTTWSPPLLP